MCGKDVPGGGNSKSEGPEEATHVQAGSPAQGDQGCDRGPQRWLRCGGVSVGFEEEATGIQV